MPLPLLPDVSSLLAALPFLPRGKGALILILGGLAVLPASLLWSRMMSGMQWVSGLEPGAARLGLGPCKVRSANEASCIVTLLSCPGCRDAGKSAGPCETQRLGLLQLALARAPHPKVTEVACNRAGRGACTFVVQRGPPA